MQIEQAVEQVERLYHSITGTPAPNHDQPYAPILPEKNPAEYVGQQINRLMVALDQNYYMLPVQPSFNPSCTVWESQSEILIRMDMAGVKRDDIDVSIQGPVLIVRGRRHLPEVSENYRLCHQEMILGEFEKHIPLPFPLKSDELTNKLVDGVFEVVIPKATQEGSTTRTPRKSK